MAANVSQEATVIFSHGLQKKATLMQFQYKAVSSMHYTIRPKIKGVKGMIDLELVIEFASISLFQRERRVL